MLRTLWHLRLRGDEEEVPVEERAWYRQVLEEPDPERKLRLVARASRTVKERAGPSLRVIRTAALVDPDIATLWERIESDFHANQRGIVQTLHAAKALRRGLGVARGTDILWTLNHPDLWHLLVGERGWTPAAWERCFLEAARAQLLAAPAEPPERS